MVTDYFNCKTNVLNKHLNHLSRRVPSGAAVVVLPSKTEDLNSRSRREIMMSWDVWRLCFSIPPRHTDTTSHPWSTIYESTNSSFPRRPPKQRFRPRPHRGAGVPGSREKTRLHYKWRQDRHTARSKTDMTAALEAIGCSEEGKQPPVILLITSPPIVEEQYEW